MATCVMALLAPLWRGRHVGEPQVFGSGLTASQSREALSDVRHGVTDR
jgi:hypothetical protein